VTTLTAAQSALVRSSSPRAKAAATLRRSILRGTLRPGDRLPAENELATRLHISRGTVRMALDMLEREGLVRRRRNHGCVVLGKSAPRSLLSSTVVLISNIQGDIRPQLFGGQLRSINSGIFDATVTSQLNFMSMHSQGDPGEVLANLVHDRPFGVLITAPTQEPRETARLAGQLVDSGLPLVIFGDEEGFNHLDRVVSDHQGGAYQLVHWLARQGRKRIARVWSVPDASWSAAHDQGYLRAVKELRLQPLPVVAVPDLLERRDGDRDNFDRRARQLLGFLIDVLRRPGGADAVMVGTDSDAYLVAAACRLLGMTPNRDVLITGYDDYWAGIPERQWESADPAATINKQNYDIGQAMVRLLSERVAGHLPAASRCVTIEQRLVVNDAAPRR
jgi:DNA-binding LacI/PurR family transcriptional regulator